MNIDEYEKMYRQEETSWWFCGRQAIVESILEKYTPFGDREAELRILDIGCGTGKILRNFEDRGHTVIGLDFSGLALEFTSGRGASHLVQGDAQKLPFEDGSFDLIVALDIMEHVPDDLAMANEMMRVLKPGGAAVLNVPAHPILWSEHDLALHHYRRYTKRVFREVLKKAGFKSERLTYSICSVYPAACVFRLIGKLKPKVKNAEPQSHMFAVPGWLNSLLRTILVAESRVIRWVNMPFGLSLLTLQKKR